MEVGKWGLVKPNDFSAWRGMKIHEQQLFGWQQGTRISFRYWPWQLCSSTYVLSSILPKFRYLGPILLIFLGHWGHKDTHPWGARVPSDPCVTAWLNAPFAAGDWSNKPVVEVRIHSLAEPHNLWYKDCGNPCNMADWFGTSCNLSPDWFGRYGLRVLIRFANCCREMVYLEVANLIFRISSALK